MKKAVVVLLGTMLVLTAALMPTNTSNAQKAMPTKIMVDMNGCTNSVTCSAQLMVGDMVTFTGALVTADGEPISGADVRIVRFLPTPELVTVAEGKTGEDGGFELTWKAELSKMMKGPQDVTKKMLSESPVFYAQFDGDEQYATSRSGKLAANVQANMLKAFVNANRGTYNQGESAIITFAFVDSKDKFVDPDSLRVVLNDEDVKAEKKKAGSYVLNLSSLPKEHTQILVLPKKSGYNTENAYYTIIVDGLK